MYFSASEGCFWPLTASMTSKVKNNHAYVITQDICNKFIDVNFCLGCMVSQPNPLLQGSTNMSLINEMIIIGTSDAWSNPPSNPAHYIEDCRISEHLLCIGKRFGSSRLPVFYNFLEICILEIFQPNLWPTV